MRKFIRRHIFVKLLLPALFIAYMGSISLFPHSHIIDGCKIVHSHPFADDEHGHDAELARTILILSTFSIDGNILQGLLPSVFLPLCGFLSAPSVQDGSAQCHIQTENRRGPPATV
ncbi:MAG TPA: hypothetical protein IAC03_06595 [Candidatus Coprenecus pullistercoris]|nr:hypothetical protein [Candidatus Coprenecus pullistercoris]